MGRPLQQEVGGPGDIQNGEVHAHGARDLLGMLDGVSDVLLIVQDLFRARYRCSARVRAGTSNRITR